ncbi:MAG: T9SS type A sorting domain-containing protein [Flavobacteriaceae bacterium]
MKTVIKYVLTYGYWLLAIGLLLTAYGLQAQSYEWQWAKHGGGTAKITNEGAGNYSNDNFEHIIDIVTDEDNNYYFLGRIASGSTHVDGNPVPDYGIGSSGRNIIITSFTCGGVYRWSRVIGGGGGYNYTFKLITDNNGGIYVSVRVNNTSNTSEPQTCFSDDDCLPYLTGGLDQVQEGRKTNFLLKYDTETGELVWRKNYQGNVNYYNSAGSNVYDLQIDSNNVLHTIISLQEGVHLDGALTVELDEDEINKYYLVKFDSAGNLVGTPLLLPMSRFSMHNTTFRYDEVLNRYYLSGWGSNINIPSFNGTTFQVSSQGGNYNFFLSFNPNDLDDWWYKEITVSGDGTGGNNPSLITDIAIDDNSDIYISGSFSLINVSTNYTHFGDYTFNTTYSGFRPFVLKMNSQGVVQWSKIPDEQPALIGEFYNISLNNNELAVALSGRTAVWGNYSIAYPLNIAVPYLLRLDKQTGEAIGLYDISSNNGTHRFTAVTADQDGNYVVGGAMRYSLFTDSPNGVAPLYNTSSSGVYTDFFMARLAATECGTAVVSVDEHYKPQLRLYPNPTNGLVYIEAEENIQSYEVYNIVGQRLMNGNSNVINLQELSIGTYIVKVKMQSGSVSTQKIVKN